jgi:nicotinamidase-related amidase
MLNRGLVQIVAIRLQLGASPTNKEFQMSEPLPDLEPSECALLVLDFQNLVLGTLPDSDVLVKQTAEAVRAMRAHGVQIVFVRVGLTEQDFDAVPETNIAFSLAAKYGMLKADDPTTAFHHDLTPRCEDLVARKVRVGAFSRTNLDEQLTNLGITTLFLAGLHTSGVVLSTVREAADRDYRMVLLEECIADPDAELHKTLMTKVFPKQAAAASLAEVDSLF